MASSKQGIIKRINAHIRQYGDSFRQWYVGISKDARSRLFSGHNVDEGGDPWIYDTAFSSQEARDVENYFVNSLGTDGGTGGGDYTSNQVYAYRRAVHTVP